MRPNHKQRSDAATFVPGTFFVGKADRLLILSRISDVAARLGPDNLSAFSLR